MNRNALLGLELEQCTTVIIFVHDFYALQSSAVFHNYTVVLLSGYDQIKLSGVI